MSPANPLQQPDPHREPAAAAREAANDPGRSDDLTEARRARLLAAIWSAIDGE